MGKKLFSGIEALGFDFANELNIFEDKTKEILENTQEETKLQEDKLVKCSTIEK